MVDEIHQLFDLKGKTAIITGGAGLLGVKHAEALMEFGANCVLLDIVSKKLDNITETLNKKYQSKAVGLCCDITQKLEVESVLKRVTKDFGNVDILINNAANNPKAQNLMENGECINRFESFPVEVWDADLCVGLKGAFLCTQIFGGYMSNNGGVILNIASDLGVIAPDQRIYQKTGVEDSKQPTKPVTYSVVKTGLIGLTKYTATYWADKNMRCNALVPGGVYDGQDAEFLSKLINLIPMSRMANQNEYKAAIVFLCSQASSYMTGSSIIIDGGRTCW